MAALGQRMLFIERQLRPLVLVVRRKLNGNIVRNFSR